MDPFKDLLDEIQRIQCLVCAYHRDGPEERGVLSTRELLELLEISPSECGRVVSTLTSEGLFESVPDPLHPLPRALRLTDVGRRYLRQWNESLPPQAPRVRPRSIGADRGPRPSA